MQDKQHGIEIAFGLTERDFEEYEIPEIEIVNGCETRPEVVSKIAQLMFARDLAHCAIKNAKSGVFEIRE